MNVHKGRALVWLLAALAAPEVRSQSRFEYEVAKLVMSDGGSADLAGSSVATSGDVVVVGVPFVGGTSWDGKGAAYVFRWNGAVWLEEQKLVPGDDDSTGLFGYEVAADADLIVVGAPYSSGDAGDSHLTGAAHVFRWNGSAWIEEQKLVASDGGPESKFGYAVDVSGDVIVVGENWDYAGLTAPHGAAYVYRWQGSAWIEEQKLASSAGQSLTDFGFSVAVWGDEIFVGEPNFDVVGGEAYNHGAVSVFRWNGSSWLEVQRLLASDAGDQDYLGRSLDLDQDVALVSAPFDDLGEGDWHGSAYVFRRAASGWVEEQKLVASDSQPSMQFGQSLAMSGDVVVVGAYLQDIGPSLSQGAGYVFRWNGLAWVEEQWLVDSDGQLGDFAGFSVALAGAVAVMGASGDDTGRHANQGSACVFDVQGNAWTWLGQSLAGSSGVPVLTASGDLSPGSAAAFHLAHARPLAAGYVIVGASKASMDFKGGVLVPYPDDVIGPFVTDEQGSHELKGRWPPGIPSGFMVWGQAWIVDAQGPQGLAASNAIAGTAP